MITTIMWGFLNYFSRVATQWMPTVSFPKAIEDALMSIGAYMNYLNQYIRVSTLFDILDVWIIFSVAIFTFRLIQIV